MIRRPSPRSGLRTRIKKPSSECCILECKNPRTSDRRSCVEHVDFFDRIRADLAQEEALLGGRTFVVA